MAVAAADSALAMPLGRSGPLSVEQLGRSPDAAKPPPAEGSVALDAGPEGTPQRKAAKPAKAGGKKGKLFINLCNTNYTVLTAVSRSLGMGIVRGANAERCNIVWHDTFPGLEVLMRLKPWQRINHFPGTGQITRKDNLARNINRMQRMCPSDFKFAPRSWILPAEMGSFRAYSDACRRKGKPKTFIYKPCGGARGEGIHLTQDAAEVPADESLLVQEYLPKPFLIDGFKFDLRLYVLVTSCSPLRIFLYKDGLVRLSTARYAAPTSKNIDERCMHLTNYSVNKKSDEFELTDDMGTGSKRSVKWLVDHLKTEGHDVDRMWARIAKVINKTMIVSLPHVLHGYQVARKKLDLGTDRKPFEVPDPSVCFEILGFDIFLDKKLRPYIIEVNRAPSFSCDSEVDSEIKTGVLTHALKLLNMKPSDKRKGDAKARERAQSRLLGSPKRVPPESKAKPDAATWAAGEAGATRAAERYDEWERKRRRREELHSGDYDLIYPPEDASEHAYYEDLITKAHQAIRSSVGIRKPMGPGKSSTTKATKMDSALSSVLGGDHPKTVGQAGRIPSAGRAAVASAVKRATEEELRQREAERCRAFALEMQAIQIELPADPKAGTLRRSVSVGDTAQILEDWENQRAKVATYWLRGISSKQRHHLVHVVKSTVTELVRAHWPRRDLMSLRMYRVISRVCERLMFSQGQGLWNCFDLPDETWKSIGPLLTIGSLTPDEQLVCVKTVKLCKESLLLMYQLAAHGAESPRHQPGPEPVVLARQPASQGLMPLDRPTTRVAPQPGERQSLRGQTFSFETVSRL